MEKIEKLKIVLEQLDKKSMEIFKESNFCRKRNFNLEAGVLYEKYQIYYKIIQEIRMKVVDEQIDV